MDDAIEISSEAASNELRYITQQRLYPFRLQNLIVIKYEDSEDNQLTA
jgi:hypothetical protein